VTTQIPVTACLQLVLDNLAATASANSCTICGWKIQTVIWWRCMGDSAANSTTVSVMIWAMSRADMPIWPENHTHTHINMHYRILWLFPKKIWTFYSRVCLSIFLCTTCDSVSLYYVWQCVSVLHVTVCLCTMCESVSLYYVWECVSVLCVTVCLCTTCDSVSLYYVWECVSVLGVTVCLCTTCDSVSLYYVWECVGRCNEIFCINSFKIGDEVIRFCEWVPDFGLSQEMWNNFDETSWLDSHWDQEDVSNFWQWTAEL